MVYPFNGILLGDKKKWNTDTCHMDESQKTFYAEQNMLDMIK